MEPSHFNWQKCIQNQNRKFISNASFSKIPVVKCPQFLTVMFPPGAFLVFWSEGCKVNPPVNFYIPLQEGANFFRGVPTINQHTYKQMADIWLTYCYISSSQDISLPFHQNISLEFSFKRALIKQIIIKLYLVWPNPYLSCLYVSANSVPQ